MTNNSATQDLTLIVGGTGKTGSRVASRLIARGHTVRVGSRSNQPAFDWENQDTWLPALHGVTSAYVTYYPDLAVPEAVDTVSTFSKLAVQNGVQRLVLLSGRGEQQAELSEQAVQNCGAEWTILRCSWFNQNFSENYLLEPILQGEVALPVDAVTEPFVDAEDIADVAVAALTEDGHAEQLYELTGPRLLTFADAVAEIAEAASREIRFIPLSLAEYTAALADQVPEEFVSLLTYLFTEVLDGRNSSLTDGVQRALGRNPKDFRDYARQTATTGVWRS